MDDRLSDILAACLQRVEAGATLDECLAAHPAERGELEPLLRVAARLRGLPRPAPLPATARAALTSQVLGQVRAGETRLGAARAPQGGAGPQVLGPSALLAGVLRAFGYHGPLAQPWLRLGVLALALALALAVGATVYAVARSILPAGPAALERATRFDLTGPIEATSEASLVIAGITLDLGPETTITGTPARGATARATGSIRDDGTLLAETVAVEAVAAAPTAAPAATAAPPAAPTSAPPPAATATPAPPATAAPTAAPAPPPPTAAPAAPEPAGSFAPLRQLLEAGRADGRAGGEGDWLLARLGDAEQAFAAGDARRAGDRLRDLDQRLRETARERKIDRRFAQEAQRLIREIEAAYNLRASPNEGRGGDDDDDGGDDGGDDGDD